MSDENVRKLLLKPGMRLLVAADPGGYAEAIRAGGSGLDVHVDAAAGPFDAVLLFAPNRAALQSGLTPAIEAVRPGGLVWVAYRKQPKSDLNRNGVVDVTRTIEWTPVTQIALDERWSAMRIRSIADVGR